MAFNDADFAFTNDMGSGAEALREGGIPLATGQWASGNTESTTEKVLQALVSALKNLGKTKAPLLPIPTAIRGDVGGTTNLPPLDFSAVFSTLTKQGGRGLGGGAKSGGR